VPQHTELAWIFNCITPVGDLERMTQFKEKARVHRANVNMGLMDYPVLQAADILIYKAEFVPVGEDQVQHIELSREIARRFNRRFGHIFPEPQAILSEAPRILGLDGSQKMSKSLNNYIGLLEDEAAIWEKLRVAKTDEGRKRRYDPGDPFVCNVFTIHKVFSGEEFLEGLEKDCRAAKVGCVDCKRMLFKHMMEELSPLRERASSLRKDEDYVLSVLLENANKLREIAQNTMDEVREALGLLR
jgi:tryptophanyl-tRNA synthetase